MANGSCEFYLGSSEERAFFSSANLFSGLKSDCFVAVDGATFLG